MSASRWRRTSHIEQEYPHRSGGRIVAGVCRQSGSWVGAGRSRLLIYLETCALLSRNLELRAIMLVPSPLQEASSPVTGGITPRRSRGSTMRESHSASYRVPIPKIECPRCPTCHTRMQLAHIKTGSSGLDLRTFECAACHHVHREYLATDPMKSDTLGWLFADLNPPS
jgi:hypothetical protein